MLDVTKLEESSTYQLIYERSKIKGKSEGMLEEARKILLRVYRNRLGVPSETILKRLEGIDDLEDIHRMLDRLQEVESWDELLPNG